MVTSLLSRNNTTKTGHYFSSLNFFFSLIWSQEFWDGQTLSPFSHQREKRSLWRLIGLPSCQLDLVHTISYPICTTQLDSPPKPAPPAFPIPIHGTSIIPVAQAPNLGVTLDSTLSLHIIHPSVNQTTLAPPEMSPKSSHLSSPLLLHHRISARSLLDLLPVSTFAPTPHSILYTSVFCLLKICQIKSLWTKPSSGFPYILGWEQYLPSRWCSLNIAD